MTWVSALTCRYVYSIKMLSDGMNTGDLVVLAADTSFNTVNINLVGLAETGIEFTPVN